MWAILNHLLTKCQSNKKTKKVNLPKAVNRVFPNWTDVGLWRKKNRLGKKTRVYKMFGNYATIRKALQERGWVENKDKTSTWFDFLWTLKQKDIDYENLRDGQIVNHFRYNGVITTKVGLWRNIHKVIHFSSVDVDSFFPKWYALKDEGEWEEFWEQFKVLKAESILKRFVKQEQIDPDLLDVAMTIWRRNLLELDDIIDNPIKALVKDSEWYILRKDDKRKTKGRGNKSTSLAPVRKNNVNTSPLVNGNMMNIKREASYKSPSIVTLKLPEIEGKQMYSTLKELRWAIVDQHVKEELAKSMIESK